MPTQSKNSLLAGKSHLVAIVPGVCLWDRVEAVIFPAWTNAAHSLISVVPVVRQESRILLNFCCNKKQHHVERCPDKYMQPHGRRRLLSRNITTDTFDNCRHDQLHLHKETPLSNRLWWTALLEKALASHLSLTTWSEKKRPRGETSSMRWRC